MLVMRMKFFRIFGCSVRKVFTQLNLNNVDDDHSFYSASAVSLEFLFHFFGHLVALKATNYIRNLFIGVLFLYGCDYVCCHVFMR